MNPVLDLSSQLTVLPIVHASADFAVELGRRLRATDYDCLAVPLPPSFAVAVESGVERLPQISVVMQRETTLESANNYVPIDPCQGVVAAIREAIYAGVERAFVDLEVMDYEEQGEVFPDPFALKEVRLEKFLAALLPALRPPSIGSQRRARICRMAYGLHRLELDGRRVVFVCSVADWPWIRQAYHERWDYESHCAQIGLPELQRVGEESLYFVLGELPYITYLYEHRRAESLNSAGLGVDGIKALLVEARQVWLGGTDCESPRLTPQCLSLLLRYVRNLTVLDRRLTPELYNLALAAKQIVGDDYALALIDVARDYPPQRISSSAPDVAMGWGQIVDADGEVKRCKNRLEGVLRQWRSLPLRPNPAPARQQYWQHRWDPMGQVSYPPEDIRIENFQLHVREQARLLIGNNQARVEKFSASLKDGLDIRETLRNWHTGDIYVREMPPAGGEVEIVIFLFDIPAEPSRYSWRSTWFAEHGKESTLSFFATPFADHMIGPGIGQSVYGGCFFLYPPRPIIDVWRDSRLDSSGGLEGRLVAGALCHSRSRRVVLVAPKPPQIAWRRLARHYKRHLVYLPLHRFSPQTVDRLRRFHVLNGKDVRSYAARYIRDLR